MRHWRATSAVFLLLAVLVTAREAAADPATIVHVRSSNPALDKRLDAELSTLGFAVKVVDAGDPALDLETIARANGAVAGVRLDSGDAVELWAEPRPQATRQFTSRSRWTRVADRTWRPSWRSRPCARTSLRFIASPRPTRAQSFRSRLLRPPPLSNKAKLPLRLGAPGSGST